MFEKMLQIKEQIGDLVLQETLRFGAGKTRRDEGVVEPSQSSGDFIIVLHDSEVTEVIDHLVYRYAVCITDP